MKNEVFQALFRNADYFMQNYEFLDCASNGIKAL